ncbi:flagellar hook-length control protein FliK [Campylobacter troglodytis]|uniref:flagellar hook-length control protein FliK n=1 Tax=Campylobacter troglodytis TaxID=654363 RepID=UPI001157E6C8|nr:flagellar hook-length control protein FliK [Campylobacter troglodytis]TQR56015.1 hypothetical protein DMC01_09500 [Campylobacter troglodytis]
MSDLSSQNTVLDLAPKSDSKTAKLNSQKTQVIGEKQEEANSNEPHSFLASLLEAIDDPNEFLPQRLQVSEKEIVEELMFKIEKTHLFGELDQEKQGSIFETLSFMEVLGVLENLQIKNADVKLSQLSSLTQQFLQTQNKLDLLKQSKNLNELLTVAKDLNLQISKIKIDHFDGLKDMFPNLNKANFFNTKLESVFKELVNTKIAQIIKESGIKNETKHKESDTLISKALKELTSKDLALNVSKFENETKEEPLLKVQTPIKEEQTQTKALNKEADTVISKALKELTNKDLALNANKFENETKEEPLIKTEQKQAEPLKEPMKEKALLNLEQKDEKPRNIKNEEPLKESKQEPKVINIHAPQKEPEKVVVQTVAVHKNEALGSKELKNSQKEASEVKEKLSEFKEKAKTEEGIKTEIKVSANDKPSQIKETKTQLPQNDQTKPIIQESKEAKPLNQEPKIDPKNENSSLKLETSKEVSPINQVSVETKSVEALPTKTANKEEKINLNEKASSVEDVKLDFAPTKSTKEDTNELNSMIKDLSQLSKNELKSGITVKETLTQFSYDLKEQIASYKPPLTRFNLTLNPSNLGEVEVTLIQRGSNLHISFNSNTNTMNLFIQNQAEFKNSLVNMGFTGLEMNFSDQSKKERQQQNKKFANFDLQDELENLNPNSSLELVLARYF